MVTDVIFDKKCQSNPIGKEVFLINDDGISGRLYGKQTEPPALHHT